MVGFCQCIASDGSASCGLVSVIARVIAIVIEFSNMSSVCRVRCTGCT